MPACPPDVELRLYEDALLELARAARAFAAAIDRACDSGAALGDGVESPLAGRMLEDCRQALVPALVRAPGMLQLFVASS
jgi:hypothetical protein